MGQRGRPPNPYPPEVKEEIKRLWNLGNTSKEIARELEEEKPYKVAQFISNYKKEHPGELTDHDKGPKLGFKYPGQEEKDLKILELRRLGLTLEQIGVEMKITRERVRQRLKRVAPKEIKELCELSRIRTHEEQFDETPYVCLVCGERFTPDYQAQKYCDQDCKRLGRLYHPSLCKGMNCYEERLKGITWKKVAQRCKITSQFYAVQLAIRYAEKTGLPKEPMHGYFAPRTGKKK